MINEIRVRGALFPDEMKDFCYFYHFLESQAGAPLSPDLHLVVHVPAGAEPGPELLVHHLLPELQHGQPCLFPLPAGRAL